LWIFDTDHVSLVLRGHPKVISRIGQLSTETRTTIITVQEIFNGWIGELNQASTQREVILAQYHQLFRAIDLLNSLPILEFDDRAYDRYETLLAQNQNLRKKRLHFRTMLQL
jgi:tRNA(fMet)-specific endonuclease VapC